MSDNGMATLRGWLDEAGFNWYKGRILWQDVGDKRAPGWHSPIGAKFIDFNDDPILDIPFCSGHGDAQCPRIIAEDAEAIYFPAQYDGATWLVVIQKDIAKYLDWKDHESPYPGG